MDILRVDTMDLHEIVEAASPPRSPGCHCSTIIRDLLQRLDPKTYTDDDPDWTRLSCGFMVEDLLGDYWARRHLPVERPGEFVRDGIICSPDGLRVDRWRTVEVKGTWRSSRHEITSAKYWGWWTQIKAYCHVAGTLDAELWACFMNGDYRYSGPQVKVYTARFTPRELEENWTKIVNHARHLKMVM